MLTSVDDHHGAGREREAMAETSRNFLMEGVAVAALMTFWEG